VSRIATENNILHILVGHQVFIDTKSRLRRVYVAEPTVLNSVTLTPNQIVLTAMGPGTSALTLLDEIGRAQSYMVSSDLDIDALRATMSDALSQQHIRVEGSGGRVVLSGTVPSQAVADSAVKLAGMYSKDVVNALNIAPGHPKQVRLQVRILEVDRAKAQQYGINLFNPGGNTNFVGSTTTSQYPSTMTLSGAASATAASTVIASNPMNFFLYSWRANLGTTIQDLQTKQVLQILAEPTITTISGEKGDFHSGGEFPVPIAQPGGSGGAPVITIQWRPYGVKVEFTPIVNDDGTIRLTVAPEVSALDYANAVSISGFTVPALSTRKALTQVELRSDQSFAISGLLDQRTTDLMDKSPGIASIPILGNLFKSKNVNHSATELVVVVTPSVVDPLTDTEQPVQPDMPIPTLDRGAFDTSLGKNHNPRPAAPPLDPNRPPFGDAVPTPLPPNPNSPDGKIVGDTVSAPADQTAPAASSAAPNPAQSQQSTPAATPAQSQAISPAAPTPEQVKQVAPIAAPAAPAAPPAEQEKPASSDVISPAPAIASTHMPNVTAAVAASTAASTGVEIMALSHASDADATLSALRRHGYNPIVNHSTQDSLLHLDLGPFPTRSQAEAMRQRLIADGYNATLK
jgi:pilus assembly protein CpaC